MIEVSGLSSSIRNVRILDGLTFAVRPGEFVALVGPNGAGKTTLLKHLNGLLKPSSGTVSVTGRDTRKTKTSELARRVGFLFQNPDQQILCPTVREELSFGLRHCGIPSDEWASRVEAASGLMDLADSLDADPLMLPRSRRQRVAFASVLATGPDVLVLDEPTSAQDEAETRRIMETARGLVSGGKSVILVSHDMDLVAEYATRVLLLVDGRLEADCSPGELFCREDLLARANLVSPGLYRLASALGVTGCPGATGATLTVDSLADIIESRAAKEGQ